MDHPIEPVPAAEALVTAHQAVDATETAMDVVPGEEPKKIRLTKAEKRALAEVKRKDSWKAKVRFTGTSGRLMHGCRSY